MKIVDGSIKIERTPCSSADKVTKVQRVQGSKARVEKDERETI